MRALILAASAMLAPSVLAQTAGSCETGTSQAFLEASNVQASLFNNGNLFFGGSTTAGNGYLVPKISSDSRIFAASIWLSGLVNEQIRVSAARYGSYLLRPGPLNTDGTLPNPTDCSTFDRIYVVDAAQIDAYEAGQSPTRDLAEWPVGLGAPTVDANGDQVIVASREQVIDLSSGERPNLYGSQMAFWVMNDVGAPREANQTAPLGVEIQVSVFTTIGMGIESESEASFYRYKIINRSPNTIDNIRWSFFTDPDLENASDDYVGTDTTRGMPFVYNPSAIGYDILSHRLTASSSFINGGETETRDPSTAEEYFNYMQGLWGNGTPITEGNQGYLSPGATTPYVYSGDPVTSSFWSEVNVDRNGTSNPYGDRRLVTTAALGNLPSGDTTVVDLGILYAPSIRELRSVSDGVQAAYDAGTLFTRGASPKLLTAPELVGPMDGRYLKEQDRIQFSWHSVNGAEGYKIRWGSQPDGPFSGTITIPYETSIVLPVLQITEVAGTQPVYWQVSALAPNAIGAWSTSRSVTVYRGGPLELADGSPAFVEVSGPSGADPCADGVISPDGCEEVFGNLVYNSFNSTGDYYFGAAMGRVTDSQRTLQQYAPNDFEIRFTETGSLGYYTSQTGAIVPVPFELWDIGVVAPGEANDPADDVRLIPILFADNGGTCAFNADEISDGEATLSGYVESDRINAYYPTTSYANFELTYADSVATAPDRCYIDADYSANAFFVGTRPIQNQVFGSLAQNPALPKVGTVIRLYTNDPLIVANEDTPRAGDLRLGPAYPNPTASSLTVPYTLASPSAVELAVVDVLGRRVLELVNARQPEGAHTAHLDARALAPGLYIVRLRAGEEVRTTRITIVR